MSPASPRTYRVGIIGCGRMAGTIDEEKRSRGGRVPQPAALAPAYRQVPRTDLVAAAEVDGARREAFSRRWGIAPARLYADYRDMLANEALDIVSVATHAHLHAEMTVAAAEAGVRAVLCEKAMAVSLPEADRMIAACRKAGTKLVVHYHNRWDPLMVRVRDLVADGAVGRLISIAGTMGPELVHEASHLFDFMRFLTNDEVAWAAGHLDDETHPDPGGSGCLGFRNGVHAFVNAVRGCPVAFEFDIIGERGRIRVGYHADELWTVEENLREGRALVGRKIPQNIEARSGTVKAIEDIVACLDQDKESACAGEDGRAALEIALAFHISHRQGGAKVRLPIQDASLRVLNPKYFAGA